MSKTSSFAVSILTGATLLFAGAATAEPKAIREPNGTAKGNIDGHAFELPVHCMVAAGFLDVSSHDQPISNSTSIGGVEPAINVLAFDHGFQVVMFIGGSRYKFLRAGDKIEAFPFTLTRDVRAGKQGKVEVDLTLDCPST